MRIDFKKRWRWIREGMLILSVLTMMAIPNARAAVVSEQVCTDDATCPAEDVVNTKHNLRANPDILAVGPGTNTEVCVFCHTPHGANVQGFGSAPPGTAPLWNRRIPDSAAYDIYKAPNFDGAGTDAGRPKGVSLACLSCHDGTIALDAIINAPGSGGYNPANIGSGAPGVSNPDITFSGPAMGGDDSLAEGNRTDSGKTGMGTIAGGSEPFPNLGTDLRNDHPIGMEIPATDPQFNDILAAGNNELVGTDGTGIWKLKRTGQNFQSDKRDQVRAYPSTSEAGKKYIECASCHNPHTPRPVFLRLPKLPGTDTSAPPTNPNQSSALCLTCHQK